MDIPEKEVQTTLPLQKHIPQRVNKDGENEVLSIPSAVGAEKSVLSLMLRDCTLYVGKAIELGVNERYFYLSGHKILWNLLETRFNSNEPTDITSISQKLTETGDLDALGGLSGLAELYSYDTLGGYFDHHLGILREKFILRSIIHVCNDSVSSAYTGDMSVSDLLDQVEQSVLSIRESCEKKKGETFAEVLSRAIKSIEALSESKGKIQGISSGYPSLDYLTNGLKGGEMFVIAARPSMGKTSFLMNIIENIAVVQKKPTLVFSCEMPSLQLVQRLIYSMTGIDRNCIMNGLDKSIAAQLANTVKQLAGCKLVIDDTSGISISELRAKARRIRRDNGELAAIGVDYLQLVRSHSKQAQSSREREIAEISAGLKGLAKELDVPVIVLAQLNRGPENRPNGSPRMSDLRESGAIEQDADMIGLLYRTAYYKDNINEAAKSEGGQDEADHSKETQAFLDLAKNRNGATGTLEFEFIKQLMRFVEPRHQE